MRVRFAGTVRSSLTCQPAPSRTSAAWVPAGTARDSSARKTCMAAVETSGSTRATPSPRSGQTAPNRCAEAKPCCRTPRGRTPFWYQAWVRRPFWPTRASSMNHSWRFLREVREVRGERLGRPGRGRQVLLEHFPGRPVAEATPGRVVEPVGEPAQVGARERLGRALARQEAADPAVQVLDATLLPGGVRVAEVGLHREVAVE